MKIIKQCLLDGEEVKLQSELFILELSNTGRGFVTVETDADCVGKSLEFNLGEYDDFYCWFTGYVETEQAVQNGYKRLFVRENVAKLEQTLNCSHRHITLADLCQWLENKTGIEFKYPDAAYSQTKIPLFTHTGSGYQLLHSIGRLFAIKNYIWQQSPDGSVYVGAWDDCRWAQESEQLAIDSGDLLNQTSNAISIPINARIRPACLVNGHRITRVKLDGDSYELQWDDIDDNGKVKQKSADKRAIEREFPELAGGYHLPKFAKVVAVADPAQGGEISDPFRPRYAVDVQILDEDGNEDTTIPVYPAVQLPVSGTGSQGGDFGFPEVGTIVKLDFINGRSDKPVISSFYVQGKTVPQVAPNEKLRQQRPEVFERVDGAGNMHRETDQKISEKSFSRTVETETEHKTIGTKITEIDSNDTKTVGGNKKAHVVGNDEQINGGDKTIGVGGNLVQKVQGAVNMLAEVKQEMIAPKSFVGSAGQNIFRILETIIGIQSELTQAISTHTHNGSPKPDQSATFVNLKNKTDTEKGKLTPIIV